MVEASIEASPTQATTRAGGVERNTATLRGAAGVVAEVDRHGAALVALRLPDREGRLSDVLLAPGTGAGEGRGYFGACIGRVAGRISGARATVDGRVHDLSRNDGDACLHGGARGFDTRDWEWVEVDDHHARLRLVSDAGDEGFPGRMVATVEYRFDASGALWVDFTATCDADTLASFTHHPFWNLAGEGTGSIDDHRLRMPASRVVELDARLLPTGRLLAVQGPFDFRTRTAIGRGMRGGGDAQVNLAGGYDHYWVLDAPVDGAMRVAARLDDPMSGRTLEVATDQPGLQVYSGNFLDGSVVGKSGRRYDAHAGICLEPQAYPDAANRPEFPSIALAAGHRYRHRIRYRFGTEDPSP